jgi:dCMP deaminase
MNEITINPNRIELDEAYLQMAEVWARRSKGNRLQVGCLIVKDKQIISDGYNGMPAGSADDVCEVFTNGVNVNDGLRTKREVLHAESNALMKIAENGGTGAQDATLYTTWSPCFECSKLIRQAKIKRVVFRNAYRDMDGVQFLHDSGVEVVQLLGTEPAQIAPSPPPPSGHKPPAPPVIASETPRPQPPAKPSLSMLQAVAGGNDEIARLRAAGPIAPPVPPAAELTPFEQALLTTPQQEASPLASDDEVAALLRAHEASVRPAAAGALKPAEQVAEGPYRSNFT